MFHNYKLFSPTEKQIRQRKKISQRYGDEKNLYSNYFNSLERSFGINDIKEHPLIKMQSLADEHIFKLENKEIMKEIRSPKNKNYNQEINSINCNNNYLAQSMQIPSSNKLIKDYNTLQNSNSMNYSLNYQNSYNYYYPMNNLSYSIPVIHYFIKPLYNFPLENKYSEENKNNTNIEDIIKNNLNNNDNNSNNKIVDKENDKLNNKYISSSNENKTKEDDVYCLPVNKDDIYLKEKQKIKLQQELLMQIEEARKRKEEQKRKDKEDDRLEIEKYKEYLLMKKEQQEQQADKLNEKLNKKLNLLNESINNDNQILGNLNQNVLGQNITSENVLTNQNFNNELQFDIKNIQGNFYKKMDEEIKKLKDINLDLEKYYQDDIINNLSNKINDKSKPPKEIYDINKILDNKNQFDKRLNQVQELIYKKQGNILFENEQVNYNKQNKYIESLKQVPSYYGVNNDNENRYKNLENRNYYNKLSNKPIYFDTILLASKNNNLINNNLSEQKSENSRYNNNEKFVPSLEDKTKFNNDVYNNIDIKPDTSTFEKLFDNKLKKTFNELQKISKDFHIDSNYPNISNEDYRINIQEYKLNEKTMNNNNNNTKSNNYV